jgi:hypothetical protein
VQSNQDEGAATADSDDDEDPPVPPFSNLYKRTELHTHAPVGHLLYNLGFTAFTNDDPSNSILTDLCASHWSSFQKPKVRKAVKLTIKIKRPTTGGASKGH